MDKMDKMDKMARPIHYGLGAKAEMATFIYFLYFSNVPY
jgi:hypothetical protein